MAVEVVSYSELDAFRQCPLKHTLAYKERWVSATTAAALRRGSTWHSMSEAHYLEIKAAQREDDIHHGWRDDPRAEAGLLQRCSDAAMKALAEAGMPEEEVDLLSWMYEGYVKKWGLDRTWLVLAVEHNALVPLLEPSGRKSRFRIKVKIDLVVRRLDLPGTPIQIVDHKSGSRLPSGKELDIDDQFGLYEWAMRAVGKQVLGSIHNAARTQRNKGPMPLEDRFARHPMARGQEELSNIAADALLVAKASRRAGEPYSSPNPDQCKWKCDFLGPHLAARKGADIRQVLAGMGFSQNFERH